MLVDERGATLVEVVVAMTVLLIAGSSALLNTLAIVDGVRMARDREAEIQEAGALLDAVYLWSRDDLDRRLGSREQGPYQLVIERPEPELYTIVVRDSVGRELLRTALFRGPEVR